MPTCLLLVDGEHYPPVIEAAVASLRRRGYEPCAALFLGGTEKVGRPLELGVPLHAGQPEATLAELAIRYRPEVVMDLSDEPIVDYRQRMRLAAVALRHGIPYHGADFRLDPPPRPILGHLPALSVIGTGKRTGKTALSIEIARHYRGLGHRVVIVTMGRGGPPEPVLLEASGFEAGVEGLRRLAELGLHAASDYAEDAVLARVDTIGTRRCGGGLAGATVDDNFGAGVLLAERLEPDLVVYEGSGTAIPPAAPTATVLVASVSLDVEYIRGYLGPYRLLISDALVLIGEGGPRPGMRSAIEEIRPQLPVLDAVYRLETTVPVAGRKVLVTTTAPPAAGPALAAQLTDMGADSVEVLPNLSNREALHLGLGGLDGWDLVLTEIKAAAIDVVLPYAQGVGAEVGFLHNRVEIEGGISRLIEALPPLLGSE